MLRLNPGDNQGVRYLLVNYLLKLDRFDDVEALLNLPEYRSESSTEWNYTRLLLSYRKTGASPQTVQLLNDATRVNPYLMRMLMGKLSPNQHGGLVTFGGPDEAASCFKGLHEAYIRVPHLIEWLNDVNDRMERGRRRLDRERKSRKRR